MFADPYLREKLRYRSNRTVEPHKCQDVFDGSHFKELVTKTVTWDCAVPPGPPRKYFAEPTDIALHFSTDGIALHKHTGMDAWPLVLTLHSLPPEIRYRREFQICCGIIPGTFEHRTTCCQNLYMLLYRLGSKDVEGGSVDYDSFLQPLLHDLKILATYGVEAREYDAGTGRLIEGTFQLRAHAITVCGDMPAVAKVSIEP